MKRRILESEEKLLIDDEKDDDLEDIDSEFDSDEDFEDIGSEKENDSLDNLEKDDLYSHYSDLYKEKHNIRPRWVHPSDVSAEDLRRMIDDLYQDPGYSDDEDDYSDHEDNKEYFDDLDAKSSEDSEIEDLAGLGPEDGEEFHTFAGMGKGRHGRNRIHEEKPADDYEECDVCGYDHEYDFPHLSDETMKKIKKLHNKINEVAPPHGEDVIDALKKKKGVKNPWAVAWSMKNKGYIEENVTSNKITIGQLRQIIREELEDNTLDEGLFDFFRSKRKRVDYSPYDPHNKDHRRAAEREREREERHHNRMRDFSKLPDEEIYRRARIRQGIRTNPGWSEYWTPQEKQKRLQKTLPWHETHWGNKLAGYATSKRINAKDSTYPHFWTELAKKVGMDYQTLSELDEIFNNFHNYSLIEQWAEIIDDKKLHLNRKKLEKIIDLTNKMLRMADLYEAFDLKDFLKYKIKTFEEDLNKLKK